MIGVAARKGGAYKTSVSVHLTQDLALKGLRALFVEGNNPQGIASMYHGQVPDLHIHAGDTLLLLYLGEEDNITYATKPICWPRLDVIPSCLALHRIEIELMGKFDEGKSSTDPHLILRLAIETVACGYDAIVINSAPNLSIGTTNAVCVADVLTVPTFAELFDYASALQFSGMFRDLLENVDLKGFEPNACILLTKHSNSNGSQLPWMEEQIRNAWGSMILKNAVRETGEIGKGQVRMRTVFEQVIDQCSSAGAWRNAPSIWESTYSEIFDRLIKPRWEIR